MYSITANFNRTYNPNVKKNALSDLKRLLTSRDTVAQNQACVFLTRIVNHNNLNPNERARTIDYLLENDITVFLCEATSNLDFELFKSVLSCLRHLWHSSRFFEEDNAAHAMAAVVRALAHYAGSGLKIAIHTCLHFLDDLLNGISSKKQTSALSHQSAYSTVQLLACLNSLPSHIKTESIILASSALVLHALMGYQPINLVVQSSLANALLEVLKKWYTLLMASLKHSVLLGEQSNSEVFFAVLCQLGIDGLRFVTLLNRSQLKVDFVHAIIADEQEINMLKQCSLEIRGSVQQVLGELIVFTKHGLFKNICLQCRPVCRIVSDLLKKEELVSVNGLYHSQQDYQKLLSNDDYGFFLKLVLYFYCEKAKDMSNSLADFTDIIFSNGYLTMLPKVQIERDDPTVGKISTLLLGEILKVLAEKYLNINVRQENTSTNDIQMGLVELQYGMEKPQLIATQLRNGQAYGLLIYIYFYCQSSEKPVETMAPILPHLVQYLLRLPNTFRPPHYIVKVLWLIFAMSTISNGSLNSLDERVYLEKATDRIVSLLHPEPSLYYTHNPAILLWAFTSQRIPRYVQMKVVTQWLKTGESLPIELTTQPILWDILLKVLVNTEDKDVVENCMDALQFCMNDAGKDEFASIVWSMLPNVLPRALINCENGVGANICYVIELATTKIPKQLDPTTCLKTALLVSAIYSKCEANSTDLDGRYHFEYVCLNISVCLITLAFEQNDNRVLLAFINREGFMNRVLSASSIADDDVACAALQLLTCIVRYFNKNNYQPKSFLQIQTDSIIQSLARDSTNERSISLIQFLYVVLNSGTNGPVCLAYDLGEPSITHQYNALRALMFRIQMTLSCADSSIQSVIGWKTLNSIFKHAIVSKNDYKLVAILTSQPWTNILIKFQLSREISEDFLKFVYNWLTLLRITLKKSQEVKKIQISKHSLIGKTLIEMKNNLNVEEELKEIKTKTIVIAEEILASNCIKA